MARQFDPVAAAAMGALDAIDNGLTQFQSQANAPRLPAQSSVTSSVRQAVQGIAQFSPFNVLARGSVPSSFPTPPQLPFTSGSAFEPPQLGNSGSSGSSSDSGQQQRRSSSAFE